MTQEFAIVGHAPSITQSRNNQPGVPMKVSIQRLDAGEGSVTVSTEDNEGNAPEGGIVQELPSQGDTIEIEVPEGYSVRVG